MSTQPNTAHDLLMREMCTNPSVIRSITVANDDDHPDFDHLDPAPCTHTSVTAEHLELCCRDAEVECELCGQPIDGLTAEMLAAEGNDGAICHDCGMDGVLDGIARGYGQ